MVFHKMYLTDKMKKYAEKLDFEKAQKIKEQLDYVEKYQSKSTIVSSKITDVDVFAIVSEKKYSYVNYLKNRILTFYPMSPNIYQNNL